MSVGKTNHWKNPNKNKKSQLKKNSVTLLSLRNQLIFKSLITGANQRGITKVDGKPKKDINRVAVQRASPASYPTKKSKMAINDQTTNANRTTFFFIRSIANQIYVSTD